MNVRALLFAVCAIPLLGGADLADTTKLDSGGVLRQAGDPDSLFRVHLPSEIYERTIASSSNGITRTTEISFPATVTLDGQAVVELYYDLIPGGPPYDHAVIAPISQYTYVGSNGSIAAKAAKVVRCDDRTIIGDATLSVAPSKVRLQHRTFSEDQAPTLVILRYLPSGVRPGSVAEGINGIPRFISIHSPIQDGAGILLSVPTLPPNPEIREGHPSSDETLGRQGWGLGFLLPPAASG